MARVKRGTIKNKRRKNILLQTKGYRFDRKKKERVAKEAIRHAGAHAFRHRRAKKRDFRRLFSVRINAASREGGISYSKLMGALKKSKVALDRKSLSLLAMKHPAIFQRMLQSIAK
jgi:large subunit ribosomal protein L20